MDANFFGSVRVNRAVLPHMRRQRSGVLMHISGAAGRLVAPSIGLYCASKFALAALAESYSHELTAQGIESEILEPGLYETPVFGNTVKAADEALFASESGDPAWNIASVLDVYRRIEDWQAAPDATRCGTSKDNALPPIGEPELF